MPTAPTFDNFIESYPSFGAEQYSAIGPSQLAISAALLDSSAWDDLYQLAVMLDCAHNLTITALIGTDPNGAFQLAAGPISSASAAGVSTSFNTLSSDGKSARKDWYNKTVYGQQLLRLWSAVAPMGVLT
jgi:hypothetical protein